MPLPTGAGGAGGFDSSLDPAFQLNFADLGSGVASILAERGGVLGTYTRATAAAAKLSTGLWKLDVASGSLRAMYSGITTTAPSPYLLGGAFEPAATQLALNPRDMTNASWTKGATATVAQTGIGIDGGANSCTRVTGGAVAATNTVLQTLIAAATSRTYSCWIQRVTGTGPVSITQDGAAFTDITAQLTTANFVLVQLNATQLNAAFGVKVDTNGDVIFVDCNQFEAGPFASTPIPAAGTRNPDVLTFATSPWLNPATGTFLVQAANFSDSQTGIFPAIFSVSDGTTNERFEFFQTTPSSGSAFLITDGGVGQANILFGSPTLSSNNKFIGAYALNDCAATVNGGTPGTDSLVTLPTVTTLNIARGGSNGNPFYGTISSFIYWQPRLSNRQLQIFSAP